MRGCNFTSNTVSSVIADKSTKYLEGLIVLEKIFTESGAAFILSGKSAITVNEEAVVLFRSNSVTRYGATFYINTEKVIDTSVHIKDLMLDIPSPFETTHTNCFLRVERSCGSPYTLFSISRRDPHSTCCFSWTRLWDCLRIHTCTVSSLSLCQANRFGWLSRMGHAATLTTPSIPAVIHVRKSLC